MEKMPKFGKTSLQRLHTCHPLLQELFMVAIGHYDCTILCGHRGEEEQNQAVKEGKSKTLWPNSKHNNLPSRAVDAAPWPVRWWDTKKFYHFAGFVLGMASQMGIDLRWGGDWDSDKDLNDQDFNDLVHFELKGEQT